MLKLSSWGKIVCDPSLFYRLITCDLARKFMLHLISFWFIVVCKVHQFPPVVKCLLIIILPYASHFGCYPEVSPNVTLVMLAKHFSFSFIWSNYLSVEDRFLHRFVYEKAVIWIIMLLLECLLSFWMAFFPSLVQDSSHSRAFSWCS